MMTLLSADAGSWLLPGCAMDCHRGWHSPSAHESYGRRCAYAELRDAGRVRDDVVVRTGPLAVDLERREVRLDGRNIRATVTEYKLLAVLASRIDRVVEHAEILHAVWGIDTRTVRRGKPTETEEQHLIRVNVTRLRRKLGPAARLLETIVGQGYLLRSEAVS